METLIEDVKSHLDIVDVISGYLDLKKVGKNYRALCPFHVEKTPSFTVSPEKQIFYCFGCGVGGDVIKFLMLIEDLSFYEAVHKAAGIAGIDIDLSEFKSEKTDNRAYELHELVSKWFSRFLRSDTGRSARDYLVSRGITPVWWDYFRIGFCPEPKLFLHSLYEKGFTKEQVERYGLTKFRNRVTIPIFDFRGRVVAFGARTILDEDPKYLNSPETDIFNKRKILYGYNLAKDHIRKRGRVFIVEGYMDVISCHMHDIRETVACLGTAFSDYHAKKLATVADRIYVLFDSDTAGYKAALRTSGVLLEHGILPSIVVLPEGYDPDSFLTEKGRDSFEKLVDSALNPVEFVVKRAKDEGRFDSIYERRQVLLTVVDLISKVQDKFLFENLVSLVSDEFGVSKDAVIASVKRPSSVWVKQDKELEVPWERELLKYVLNDDEKKEFVRSFFIDGVFRDSFVMEVLGRYFKGESIPTIMEHLPETKRKLLAALIFDEERDFPFEDLLAKLKKRASICRLEDIKRKLRKAKDRKEIIELSREAMVILKTLKDVEGREAYERI